MELKDYLLGKPDSDRFEIVYEFENRCPTCKRDFVTIDEEYSSGIQYISEFREDVAENKGHFREYGFVYEIELEDPAVSISTGEEGQELITILYEQEPWECEECSHYID